MEAEREISLLSLQSSRSSFPNLSMERTFIRAEKTGEKEGAAINNYLVSLTPQK